MNASTTELRRLEGFVHRTFNSTDLRHFVKGLRQQIRLVEPVTLDVPVCRDPDDDLVLATAIAAQAEIIVTGADDLLVLERHAGIAILSPRRFLQRLDAAEERER